jgi:hypothetical protein
MSFSCARFARRYTSPGSNRSQKAPAVPKLPNLSPDGGSPGGLRRSDFEGGSARSGMTGRTGRSDASGGLPFMKRSPSKGRLKFTFNKAKLGAMR